MISHDTIAAAQASSHSPDTVVVRVAGRTFVRVHAPPDHSDAFQDASGALFSAAGVTQEVAADQVTAWFTATWQRLFKASALREDAKTMEDIAERCSSLFPEIKSAARDVMEAEASIYGATADDRIALRMADRSNRFRAGSRLSLIRQATMKAISAASADQLAGILETAKSEMDAIS